MTEARKDIALYLIDYYHWQRPHSVNHGLALAVAEEKLNFPCGIN
jgi:putative transposase